MHLIPHRADRSCRSESIEIRNELLSDLLLTGNTRLGDSELSHGVAMTSDEAGQVAEVVDGAIISTII